MYEITDYGRMMAISKIHIWDVFGLGLKSTFLWKKQLNDGNHGQGTIVPKLGSQNIENTTKFI